MSCNGCRVLRKGCGDNCPLRTCLEWIPSPTAQAHATLFLSKFFGRTDLISFISNVPSDHQRTALFQSLLYEAAGRMVNPVNGAMGLLSTGNWHICEAAVQTVLSGGSLVAHGDGNWIPEVDESSDGFQSSAVWAVMTVRNQTDASNNNAVPMNAMIADGNEENLPFIVASDASNGDVPKLLNLFE